MTPPAEHDGLVARYGPAPTWVDYHQFVLTEDDGAPAWPEPGDPMNGLISPDRWCGALVHTGIATGNVAVSVELYRHAPPSWTRPPRAGQDWEEIAEVTVHAPDGQLRVAAMMDHGPDLPPTTALGPGPYRVRAHARGRETAYDAATMEIVEDYLFQIWPAPPAPENLIKHTDAYGASLRRSFARRPRPDR